MPERLTYADVEWEKGPCPLCGETSPSEPILEGRDDVWQKEGRFTLVTCGGCQLVYQSPRPTAATMRYYYEEAYAGEEADKAQEGLQGFQNLVSPIRLATIEKVDKLAPGTRLLDVGCSRGYFLEFARTKRGVEASGIDLDPDTVDHFINTDDIDVRCGDLLEAGYPSDSFDVVTLYETLEHVYEPVRTLEEVRRILKPGGLVVVEVPNWDAVTRMVFGSWWLPLLLPTHLQHFSRRHLALCAEKAGFEVAHQQAMFLPAEVTLSCWVGLSRLMGRPKESDKGPLRKLVELFFGLWLVGVFFFVDVPVVFFLRWIGRSGHQTLIGKKPAA